MALASSAPQTLNPRALVPVALAVVAAWIVLALGWSSHSPVSFAAMWLAMTMAMMVPTVLRPMRRAASGSALRAWEFITGFVAVWMACGVPAFAIMTAITWTPAWIALAWMAAGAYQLTPVMRRHLVDCRSVRFDGRPTSYGVRQGVRCIGSCGPVMIAVMVSAMAVPSTAISLVLLLGVTVAICWEKRPMTKAVSVAAVGLVLLIGGAGAFVLAGGSGGSPHHSTGVSTS